MTLRAEQLPIAVQRKLGIEPTRGRRPSGRSVTAGGHWICAGCREQFTTWAAVDRHSASGHRRFEIPLGDT